MYSQRYSARAGKRLEPHNNNNNNNMEDLKNMSVETLVALKMQIDEELCMRESAGKGYYKTFDVGGSKAYKPCTYKQLQYAERLCKETGSEIATTNSQMLKYFEMEDMSEAIDLMKDGKRIYIS